MRARVRHREPEPGERVVGGRVPGRGRRLDVGGEPARAEPQLRRLAGLAEPAVTATLQAAARTLLAA